MKDFIDTLRTIIGFPFGLIAETFARIALLIQPDFDVDFNYLKNKFDSKDK